jgi:hypothetical protein
MFKKVKAKKEKKLEISESNLLSEEKFEDKFEENPIVNNSTENQTQYEGSCIEKIKQDINNKMKKPKPKGLVVSRHDIKAEANQRDDNKNSSVKKVFLAESLIENAKSPEELKKLLGTNKEEIEKLHQEKRKKLVEIQKDLFTLPQNLNVINQNNNDHVDNIIKLSAAGIYNFN